MCVRSSDLTHGGGRSHPHFSTSMDGTAAEVSQWWKSSLHPLQYFMEGKGITCANCLRSCLLHHLGFQLQELYEDLNYPLEGNVPNGDYEYKKAVRILNGHFVTEAIPVYEQHSFFCQMTMRTDENTDKFVRKLCLQACVCLLFSYTHIRSMKKFKVS